MLILTISDLHAPFNHYAALDFLRDLKEQYKPDRVVCIGDEIDAHGWSRHQRIPDAPGQGDELKQAKKTLAQLFKLFPVVDVCRSNHTERAARAAVRGGIPKAFIRDVKEVFNAPQGWHWKDRVVIRGTLFVHGEGFGGQNSALKAAQVNRCNTVIGHVHSWASVQYHCNGRDCVWGMNVGCMIDVDSYGMQYAKTSPTKPTLGTGVVIDGVPSFIPMRV